MALGRIAPIYDPNSGKLFVTTELDKSISIIDPKTLKIVGSVPTTQEQSHMLVLSKDGKRGYTANVGPGTVSVLDMVGHKTLAVIPISGNTQRIAISRDGSMVFTADQKKPQLAVIDTSTNKVKSWVTLPAVGYGNGDYAGWPLASGSDARGQAGCGRRSEDAQDSEDDRCGRWSFEVVVSADGKRAYVACNFSNDISVINLSGWNVEKTISAGKFADGMAMVR